MPKMKKQMVAFLIVKIEFQLGSLTVKPEWPSSMPICSFLGPPLSCQRIINGLEITQKVYSNWAFTSTYKIRKVCFTWPHACLQPVCPSSNVRLSTL